MTTPQAKSAPDPVPVAADQIYGPALPDLHGLYLAQDAPSEAGHAGCSEAEYGRLVLERQQTEAAYLAGYDRDLVRALEADAAEPEFEAEP